MSISAPHRSSRRSLVAGFLKGLGAMSLAPAILTREADASPQVVQGRQSMRDDGPRLRLEAADVWRLPREATAMKLSPDGRTLALRYIDSVTIHETASGRVIANIIDGGPSTIRSFGFGADGTRLFTLRRISPRGQPQHSELLQVFDSTSGQLVDRLEPPPIDQRSDGQPNVVASSLDGRYIAVFMFSATREQAIVVVDTTDFSKKHVLYEQDSAYIFRRAMAISRDGTIAVDERRRSFSGNGAPTLIGIYDPFLGRRIARFPGTGQGAASLNWSPDGTLLAIGSAPLEAPGTPPAPGSPEAHPQSVHDAVWIWDARAQATVLSLSKVHAPVSATGISPDNDWLAIRRVKYSRSLGSGLSIFRVDRGAEVFTYETPDSRIINDVAFSPSGTEFYYIEGLQLKKFNMLVTKS